ncbi:MAG: class I SAM-dependent methyltransferase [Bacteroidia bacterium]
MNFDFIAPIYDRLANWVFGSVLARSRRILLTEIEAVDRTLIIGGGSGDMLFCLAERQISKQIVYLEPSSRFTQTAKDRWKKEYPTLAAQVSWVQTNWQEYSEDRKFDLITTDYLLDLFPAEDVDELVERLALWLKPGGYWLYVDFCQNEQTAWWWRPVRFLMYRFFAMVAGVPGRKISDVRAIASKKGFRIVAQQQIANHGIEAILFCL